MHLKHLFTTVCRESKIDADTNNISLFDLYEKLSFNAELNEDARLTHKPSDPFVLPFPLEVTSMFFREDANTRLEADVLIHFFDPKDKLLGEFPAHFSMEKGVTRMRNRLRLNSIAVTKSGVYKFEISTKIGNGEFKKVGDTPVEIVVDIK